jgi:chemotaxis protein CheD
VAETITVKTSDFAIDQAPQILTTGSVGSCVAICLYDQATHTGALLHVMLPRSEGNQENPLRYADTALSYVLEELQHRSIQPAHLTAKIVGGAQMFAAFGYNVSIGQRNVDEIRRLLGALGIPIHSEDVGGNHGREVEFDLSTGSVTVYSRAHTTE